MKVWPKIINQIFATDYLIYDDASKSNEEKFTLNLYDVLHCKILDSKNTTIPAKYPYNKHFLEEYFKQFMNSSNEHNFSYTYGERLGSYPNSNRFSYINQTEHIIRILNNNINSRRAIISLGYPLNDFYLDDVPCLQLIDFKFSNSTCTIDLYAYFRSQDVMAFPANAYALAQYLNYVATRINRIGGSVNIICSNEHMYERDWEYLYKNVYNIQSKNYDLWKAAIKVRQNKIKSCYCNNNRCGDDP